MTKNIVIVMLVIVSVFFTIYANIKASEAEKQTFQAMLNLQLAKENEKKAKEEEQKEVDAVAKAKIEIAQLKRQLENCQ